MIDTFLEHERDDIDGHARACFHLNELWYWYGRTQQLMEKSMGSMLELAGEMDPDHQILEEFEEVDDIMRDASVNLMHHAVMLGDELGFQDDELIESEDPISEHWELKLKRLSCHVTAGDPCKKTHTLEVLGAAMFLARHAFNVITDQNIEDVV